MNLSFTAFFTEHVGLSAGITSEKTEVIYSRYYISLTPCTVLGLAGYSVLFFLNDGLLCLLCLVVCVLSSAAFHYLHLEMTGMEFYKSH